MDFLAEATRFIQRAVQAPSSHNTQPWVFRVGARRIDLRADRSRSLPVNDPSDRELIISCGCALLNLRLAVAAAGYDYQIELFPEGDASDRLARLTVRGGGAGSTEERDLARFIEQRRTHRKPFRNRPVEPSAVAALVAAAHVEQAWLRPISTDAVRQETAGLVAQGDAAQWADARWRGELAAWMRPRRAGDGLTIPALSVPVTRWVVRTFNMGQRTGAHDKQLAATAPLLAVLGTAADDRRSWLRAGQALARVLLTACGQGLQASYLNQPLQVAALRPRLQQLVGEGFPQIVLRLGCPTAAIPAAPRRPVADVIERNPQPC